MAKIYDPVDYPPGDDRCHDELDAMTWADRDYSIEAWAYRIMQPLIGGTVVPAYFGSWTFALDTDQPGKRRWVRMIIIELIQGECMLDIILRAEQGGDMMDYSLLPLDEFRIRVLQNIIEAETTISWETAIDHSDIDTRNIMVKPEGTVVLVDFNQAYIHELSCCGNIRDTKKGNLTILPPTPLERHWYNIANPGGPFRKWIPKSWLEDRELGKEWLIQTYRNSTKYDPPWQSFLDNPYHEERSKKIVKLLEEIGRKPVETAASPSEKE